MNKFLLTLSALLVLVTTEQSAHATTKKSALAQLTSGPLVRYNRLNQAKKKQVVIYADGEVYGYACNGRKPCPAFELDKLSQKEIQRLEALVEGARAGEIQPNEPQLCLAMPSRLFNYTADNDSIVLKTGSAPCSSIYTNNGRGVNQLLKALDGYMSELNAKLPSED